MIDKREITPELLSHLTVAVFSSLQVKHLLQGKVYHNSLTADYISEQLMKNQDFGRVLPENACHSFVQSAVDYITRKNQWQNSGGQERTSALNVYDLLTLTLQDLLTISRNQMEARYEEIPSWRRVVRALGEELPLSAKYAKWDHDNSKGIRIREDEFSWPYITPHNNKQLNMLIRRGISEHHCHLASSTPYFHVSWVNLMNHITTSKYRDSLRSISEPKYPGYKKNEEDRVKEHRGELAQLRAAWIRIYLCAKLAGKENLQEKYPDVFAHILDYDHWIQLLLTCDKLQSEINAHAFTAECRDDYALAFAQLKTSATSADYRILMGERWLYYRVFRDYYLPPQQRILSAHDYMLFFVYFRLRLWARRLMVQNNDKVGFDNFQSIERRKTLFLGDQRSERSLTRLTINETLKKPYMEEMEVRLSPLPEQIERLERAVQITNEEDTVSHFLAARKNKAETPSANAVGDEDLKSRYYYVFHFLKRKDSTMEEDHSYQKALSVGQICRHHSQRCHYFDQATDILHFRETNPQFAQRVLGIDAASNEDGCRPEVFGTVFRMLCNHQFVYGGYGEDRKRLPALGKTYHAGEEFYDVVDGLRSIDEAVSFLELDCGDRLGHAIALGINVTDWYCQRKEEVSLSVQDYLDNLAWLNHALVHYSIDNTAALRDRINQDFEHWFRIVYRNNIDDDQMRKIMDRAEKYYKGTAADDPDRRYHSHTCQFDIMTYYRAWTLRGDDPSCYINGYFQKPVFPDKAYKVCANFPRRFEDRYVPEYSLLNYLYQYNPKVRKEGARRIKVNLTKEYIDAVKAIQIKMRYRIERMGISIETNPTSNVLIGSFRKYDKHPILAFFNRGLPVTEKEEKECSQLQVSINTDDRGVFYTDLETEYALLARSVEDIKDERDSPRFKKYDIYTWLDNIRIMGNEQSFRFRNEEL